MGVFVIAKFKKLTLLPGISATAIAVGAAILSSVDFFKPGRPSVQSYELLPMVTITSGVAIACFGLYLAQYLQCIMIVEIVPSKYRPIFVMIAIAIRELWLIIARAVHNNYRADMNTYIGVAVGLFLVAILHFVVVACTDWISTVDPGMMATQQEDHGVSEFEKAVSEYSLYEEDDKIVDEVEYQKTASGKTASAKTTSI